MTNYIMSKQGILIIALLMLVLPASGLAITGISMWNVDYSNLNFNDYRWYSSSWEQYIDDENSTNVFVVVGNGLMDDNTAFLKIISDTPNPNALYRLVCYDEDDNALPGLDDPTFLPVATLHSHWVDDGYTILPIYIGQTSAITGYFNNQSYLFSVRCKIYVDNYYGSSGEYGTNDEVKLTLYFSPLENKELIGYTTPNQPLADIVDSTVVIVDASFDILQLMLIITVLVCLGFLLVFSVKTLTYLVHSINRE